MRRVRQVVWAAVVGSVFGSGAAFSERSSPSSLLRPPNPSPKPRPDSGKDSSGGGCDAGLSGMAGLALLLAASLLMRRK